MFTVIGAKRVLDAGESVLLQISTQLPWAFKLFDYMDILSFRMCSNTLKIKRGDLPVFKKKQARSAQFISGLSRCLSRGKKFWKRQKYSVSYI